MCSFDAWEKLLCDKTKFLIITRKQSNTNAGNTYLLRASHKIDVRVSILAMHTMIIQFTVICVSFAQKGIFILPGMIVWENILSTKDLSTRTTNENEDGNMPESKDALEFGES